MPTSVLTSFFAYVLVNCFTPGPGNILALNTSTNYGLRRGAPLFLGIFAGYYVVQAACALFVFGIGSFLPQALGVMKYVGAAYMVWLAAHIALGTPEDAGGERRSASFLKGFLLQFVNVKIWLFGVTALTGYVTDFYASLAMLMLFETFIATVGTVATMCWAGLGAAIQGFYAIHYRPVNIILALTLLGCALAILC